MKKLSIVFVMLFGLAALAVPPPRGCPPGPRPGPGRPGCPPPPPPGRPGSDGLHDAAAITSIVANSVRIAGELNRARQPQATVVVPAQQTTVVTTPAVPAQQTTVVTTPAVPAQQTTVITTPAVPASTTVITR